MNSASTSVTQSPKPASRTRSRAVLMMLALCFVAPIFIALALQSKWIDYSPAPTRNFGALIAPTVAVQMNPLQSRQQAPANSAEAQWTVLYVAGSCGACTQELDLLAHIRQATGREMSRVNLTVWASADFALPPPEAKFSVYGFDAASLGAWKQKLGIGESGGMVFIDPLGNAMLRHVPNAAGTYDGSKIRKDLMRLLRAAQAGKRQSTGIMS
jgi:hypothetical protein